MATPARVPGLSGWRDNSRLPPMTAVPTAAMQNENFRRSLQMLANEPMVDLDLESGR